MSLWLTDELLVLVACTSHHLRTCNIEKTHATYRHLMRRDKRSDSAIAVRHSTFSSHLGDLPLRHLSLPPKSSIKASKCMHSTLSVRSARAWYSDLSHALHVYLYTMYSCRRLAGTFTLCSHVFSSQSDYASRTSVVGQCRASDYGVTKKSRPSSESNNSSSDSDYLIRAVQ